MTTIAGTASSSLALTQGIDIANSVASAVSGSTFVFFAAFDGTDNGSDPTLDGSGDTQATAVAQLASQVATAIGTDNVAYEPGVGTPDTIPGSEGFNPNALNAQVLLAAQNAYNQFATQANAWLIDHPGGSITSMITSFSRGGASAAIFSQMLYEYGLVLGPLDANGVPHGKVLIPPGTVGAVSAALILDPVLTEVSGNMDFPPTVENLTIVRAANEYRNLYTAPTYADESGLDIITVQGNHGDVGDLYDTAPSSGITSPLGGIYLDAYTQFFKNAGISNIGAVPAGLQYNPASGNPVIIHSEALSAAQILATGRFWDASTYNPDNTLSASRETTDYGAPVTTAYGGTEFKTSAYNSTTHTVVDTIVLGGTGASYTDDSRAFIVLPDSVSTEIEGLSDTIAVGENASLTFTSDSLVTGTTNTLQGSPNVVSLGNDATLTVNGWDTNIIGSSDSISLAAGDADTTISGANNDITLGVGASFTADSLADLKSDTVTYDISGGGSFTIDAETASYGSTTVTNTGTQTVSLVYGDPVDLGTLTFDTTTGTDSFTLADGEAISLSGITSDIITAAGTGTSTLQTLIDYLSDLGDTLTDSDLDDDNTAYLYPSGLPSQGTTLNLNSHSGVVSQSEFSAFTDISGVGTITAADSGTFDLASAPVTTDPLTGTSINLVATDWGGTTLIGNNENGQSLTASLFGDDTLTAGNGTGDSLVAQEGVDTLTGGSGGDTFWALNGLASGSSITSNGTDKLIASGDISQASLSGSGLTSLQIGAVDVGINSITMTASQLGGFTTINASESDTTVNVNTEGTLDLTSDTFTNPADTTINAASDSDTTITRTESSGASAIALSATGNGNDILTLGDADGDTITATGNGNDSLTAGAGAGDNLTASGNGNDTLTLGDGGGTIIASGDGTNTLTAGGGTTTITATGAGTNTITAGNGASDSITVGNGTDTATAGTGAGDTLTATTGGNTLIAGNGAGDTFTAQGGDNTLTAGNGGDTFNIYDDDNTATATGGNNTFNLQGASGLTDTSGTTIDLAGSVIDGGTGGTNTLNAASGTTLIMSDDDGSISNIQSVNLTGTLDINADQMAALTSLSFGDAFGAQLNAEDSGTYNLASIDSGDAVSMLDASTSGPVTLTNNDADGAAVTGTSSGDTLTVGAGDDDTITAILGSGDTIAAGGGDGDTIFTLGAGNTVTASGDDADVTLGGAGSATLSGDNATVLVFAAGETVAMSGAGDTVTDTDTTGTDTFVVGGGGSEASASISGKNDIYEFASNFGSDSITIDGGSANAGHIVFGSGITTQNLWFAQSGEDLQIDLMGTDESVTVSGWFNGSGSEADDVILSGGSQLTNAQVASLVSAMATYQAANPSFDPTAVSTLPSDTTLQAAVTTAWASEVTIADTAANVAAELDYLQTLAAADELASITITNSGTPLPITLAQLTDDATALGLISGSYSLAISGVSAADASTVAGDAHVTEVFVSDSAADVTADLAALQTLATAGKLGSITLTDSGTPTITVTETQLADDSGALGDIAGSYNLAVTDVLAADAATVAAESNVTSVSVTDSPANVTSNIAALETLATGGELASITLTGSGTPALTFDAADAAANADALSLLTGTFTLTVSDSAANVASNIDALGTLAAIGSLTAITLTDSGTPTLSITETQAANDATALGVITTPFAVTLGSATAATFNSAGDDVTLTGSGNVVTANGSNTEVYDGSTGGNVITLAGSDDSADLTGTGDTVTATGAGVGINDWAGGNNITLGSSDTATLYGVGSTVTVLGGGGSTVNDYGYSGGDATTLDGDTGVAYLANVGSSVAMNGNEDTAWLYSNYESAAVNGTDGIVNIESSDNTVNVTSAATGNEIDDEGAGGNTITVSGSDNNADLSGTGDTITFSGTGNNVNDWTGGNSITLGDSDTAYLYASGSTATLAGDDAQVYDLGPTGGNTITMDGDSGLAVLDSIGSGVTLNGSENTAYLYADSETATVGGTDNAIKAYSSSDTISVTGSANSAEINDLGSGGNAITVGGDGNNADLHGSGDTLTLTGTDDSFSDSGTGSNTITVASGGSDDWGYIYDGGDTVTVNGTGAYIGDVGSGDNSFTVGGSDNQAVLYTSGDTVTASGTGDSIYDGTGGNTITLNGNSEGAGVHGGSGGSITANGNSDSIGIDVSSVSVTLNGDDDSMSLTSTSSGDTASLLGTGGTLSDAGSGNTITLGGSSNSATISNTGSNTLTLGGTSDTMDVTGTSGTDSVSITGTGALLEFAGATTDEISFGSGAAGTVLLASAASFAGTVAGLDSDDSIDLGNFLFSGSPTISSVTGTGATGTATTITITDGAMSTELALLNQFTNQFAVSASAYTLAADSGAGSAGTLFQLASGH